MAAEPDSPVTHGTPSCRAQPPFARSSHQTRSVPVICSDLQREIVSPIKVGVNGYGVIGKRVADAVNIQPDIRLVGVADVVADYRIKLAEERGYAVYGSTPGAVQALGDAGLRAAGVLEDLLRAVDVVVDATPKKVGQPTSRSTRPRGSRSSSREARSTNSPGPPSWLRPTRATLWGRTPCVSSPATRPAS